MRTRRFGHGPYDGISANGWHVMEGNESLAGPFVDNAVATRKMQELRATRADGESASLEELEAAADILATALVLGEPGRYYCPLAPCLWKNDPGDRITYEQIRASRSFATLGAYWRHVEEGHFIARANGPAPFVLAMTNEELRLHLVHVHEAVVTASLDDRAALERDHNYAHLRDERAGVSNQHNHAGKESDRP